MDPLYVSLAALALAAIAVGITAARKRNHIVEGMRSELDLALAENKRLDSELAAARADHHAATLKLGPEVLAKYAAQAAATAEQMGGTPREKLRKALDAARALDAGDNGRRDWSDAQLRIAIEAEVSKLKK